MRKAAGRIFLFILIASAAAVLFRSFLIKEIVRPLSRALWLFLRIFVLSIDQKLIWSFLVALIFIYLFFRIRGSGRQTIGEELPEQNSCLRNIRLWKNGIIPMPANQWGMSHLKQKLIRILVSSYASRKRIRADFLVSEAFKEKEIPLPERIYDFLFAWEEVKIPWPAKWFGRAFGLEAGKFYAELENCLDYLEKYLEIKDEQGDEI